MKLDPRTIWRATVPEAARRRLAPAVGHAKRMLARRGGGALKGGGVGLPVHVVGYFGRSHGIAASARLAARAFESLGAPATCVDVDQPLGDVAQRPALWIFHLNPPEFVDLVTRAGSDCFPGPRFGYWAWELPKAPRSWLADARLVDEIWAPSRFTAEAFAGARAAVRVVPHPLFLEDYQGVKPARRSAGFQAVTLFDFNSSAARKNPRGAVAAFRKAFGDDPACELVIKTQNGAAHPDAFAGLRAAAAPNVRIVDESWSYAQVKALIAGADALISLHRAEGFGLIMAEAMALGTPVIATAATGNVDYMDESAALLVPATRVPVNDPQRIYRGQHWFEPDVAAAAEALRRLRDERGLGERLAKAGCERVARQLSPEAWRRSLPPVVQAAVRPA